MLSFLVEELEMYDVVKKKINNERDSFSVFTDEKCTELSKVSLFQPPILVAIMCT